MNVDTQIEGEAGGAIGAERIGWIERELEAADGPVILAMHHAPVGVGLSPSSTRSASRQDDRDALRELFERGPAPELDRHRPHPPRARPPRSAACPSSSARRSTARSSSTCAREGQLRMGNDPPAIALHLHGADPRLVSHVIPLERAEP